MKTFRYIQTKELFKEPEMAECGEIIADDITKAMDSFCEEMGESYLFYPECGTVKDDYGNEYKFMEIAEEEYDLTYEQRQKYFATKTTDYNTYLYDAIQIISKANNISDIAVCMQYLGMESQDALEFLDAYKDEKGVLHDEY